MASWMGPKSSGWLHVLDERAVDGLDGVVDDEVLVGEPVDHGLERWRRCARRCGKIASSSRPWCWATTPQ